MVEGLKIFIYCWSVVVMICGIGVLHACYQVLKELKRREKVVFCDKCGQRMTLVQVGKNKWDSICTNKSCSR